VARGSDEVKAMLGRGSAQSFRRRNKLDRFAAPSSHARDDLRRIVRLVQELTTEAEHTREIEEAARAERDRRVKEARAAEEALLAAERRSAGAVERTSLLGRLALGTAQRDRGATRAAAVELARKIAQARRAEARRLNARARRLKIASERENALRRIEALLPAPQQPDRVAERPRTAPLRLLGIDTRLKTSVVFLLTLLAVGWSAWFTFFPGEDAQRLPRAPMEASGPGEEGASQRARVVPDVVGVPTSVARDRLLLADLTLGRVIPAHGPPGVVVRADPATGQAHPAGTPVILYVGVEPDRLEQEVEAP
jgi:hypothetical protein